MRGCRPRCSAPKSSTRSATSARIRPATWARSAWQASPEPTIQVAAGGHRASHSYIELVARGATAKISPILRKAADMSGGFIASCRNPVRASYVKKHAALGGISRALELGHAIMAAEAQGRTRSDRSHLPGTLREKSSAKEKSREKPSLIPKARSTSGLSQSAAGRANSILHVMNEYMAVDEGNSRLATFPDVITTLDADGRPVSVGHIKEGMELSVFQIEKSHLPLSSSVKDPAVYPRVRSGARHSDRALRSGLSRDEQTFPSRPDQICAAGAGGRKDCCGFLKTYSRSARTQPISSSTLRWARPRATGPRTTRSSRR